MKQQTQHLLEKVVLENSNDAFGLSVQMTDLRVVQQAVANLTNRIDEITHKGWHEERGLACTSILEIQDTVRLIDMAFFPLFKRMSEEVDTLNIHAQELYERMIKSESVQEVDITNKLDINSVEGWNYNAMNNNIAVFKHEFGREPESFEEVATYISEVSNKIKKADASTSTNENIAN
ncbi:hypothetical protein ACIQ6U_10380 [Lysinibacillus fusiformis]|uniref:hypothetical protein n=1 Tax=Lysinibacillus fusiformis TaxID=28031 RepID=UPI00382251C2